jgi:hypothetical protein
MPIREQTTAPEDRACIRFYAEDGAAAFANLATDLGQYERDLTVGSGSDAVYLPTPATDFLLTTRTIALDLTTSTTTACTLWLNGSAGSIDRLRIATSQYEYRVNNTDVLAIAVPAGAHQIVVVRTERNPGAAGLDDAYISTLEVMDVTNSVLARQVATHAVRTFGANDFILLANTTAGASSLSDAAGVCDKIRFSSRAVPFTEIAQDWIASLSDPTSDVELVRQGLPLTESSGAGDVGEFHGAAVQHAAAELRHTQWRTMGPAVNWCFLNNSAIDDDDHSDAGHREKIMLAPGGDVGTGYRLRLGWFGVAPLHPFCNAVWVEVLARCFNSTDADLRTFGLRIYSFDNLPSKGDVEYRYAEATFTADEAAPGSWRIQALVPVMPNAETGKTYIGLAYAMDLLDEGTEVFQIAAYSMHAVQVFDTTVGLPPTGGPAGESG